MHGGRIYHELTQTCRIPSGLKWNLKKAREQESLVRWCLQTVHGMRHEWRFLVRLENLVLQMDAQRRKPSRNKETPSPILCEKGDKGNSDRMKRHSREGKRYSYYCGRLATICRKGADRLTGCDTHSESKLLHPPHLLGYVCTSLGLFDVQPITLVILGHSKCGFRPTYFDNFAKPILHSATARYWAPSPILHDHH